MSENLGDINLGETNIDSHEKEQTIKEQQDKEMLALLNDVENLSQADTLLLFNSLAEKNPAFQAELENFQNTNSSRVVEMLKATNEHKEKVPTTIQEYFDIDNDSFNDLNNALSETGLDINELLNGYKTYLETNLEGLSKESKDKIIKSISIKVISLSSEITEIKSSSKNPEEIKNNRWIINDRLLNGLGFINKQLLPSIEAKQKIESGVQIPDKYSDKFISSTGEYTKGFMSTNANYVDINYKMGELDELLKAPVNKNGDFDEGLISTQNILSTENKQEKGLLTDLGVKDLDVSLLNESDKKIEQNAMLYFMAMIGVQIGVETLGGVTGTIAGGGIDLYDMVSKDEVLLKVLQSINLVPKDYRMDKTLLDNILAGIGIIPGVTQIIKGGKLAKFMEKVDTKVFENAIGEIKNRLGIEKVVSEKSLYEDPKYSFLGEYKEYLGKIDANDIIGEGDNAIILKHKTKNDKVIKIAKDGKVDSLKDEYENHRTFYNTLEKGRPNNVPDNIRIAEIEEFIEHKKGIYIMDKIEGQSLYTWHYKEKYADKLAIYSRENNIDIDKVSDSKFIQILDELELGRVIGYNANWDMWEKMYQKELGAFRNGVVYRDDMQQALKYLEDKGLEHIDLHSKNIMASFKNGKFIIYIIDFGKVKINK